MKKARMKLLNILLLIFVYINTSANVKNVDAIKGFSLSKEELESHLVLAKNDNIESQITLGNYYRFANYKPLESIHWFEKAAKLGSLDAMIMFSSLVIIKMPEKIDTAYIYLKLAASVGDKDSKLLLTKLCTEYKGCGYSVIDELLELTTYDSEEYGYTLLCYLNKNELTLTQYQSSAVLAVIQFYRNSITPKTLCWNELESRGYFKKLKINGVRDVDLL
jgi:TPR repeat protein